LKDLIPSKKPCFRNHGADLCFDATLMRKLVGGVPYKCISDCYYRVLP
jgi:hypothetical protein